MTHLNRFKQKPLSFNFKIVVQKYLATSSFDAYTGNIHSYPAKMFPYIPRFFYSIPQLCPPGGVILDPLCGSGTVLLQSIVHPIYRRQAYGVEINPLGRLIAKVKTTPLEETMLGERIKHLFELVQKSSDEVSIPESERVKPWFSKKAIHELGRLKYVIEKEGPEDDYKDFFWVCFSSIVLKVSLADPFIPPPVFLKIDKYKKSPQKLKFLLKFLKRSENPDTTSLFKDVLQKNSDRIYSLSKIEEVATSKVKAQIIWDDARQIRVGKIDRRGALVKNNAKTLPSESIDLILTSPPYLTAQKYVRTQKLELLWLDMVSEKELVTLQREIIGSEQISLKEIDIAEKVGVKSVDNLVKWASLRSRERAAMLYKYFSEMGHVMEEMYRVLRSGAYAVVVVGNNKVLGKSIKTYKLLTDVAIHAGFGLELIFKDKIRGRGMITGRHDTGGLINEEFIIVLKKKK